MIDIPRTLDPSTGLVRSFGLAPPQAGTPLWIAAAELSGTQPDPPLSARVVGAFGHSRSDALLRGTGEAVERYALHPRALPGTVLGLPGNADATIFHPVGHALSAPHFDSSRQTWYPGTRLADGQPRLVPSGLIDWPADDPHGVFDAGPSGAAAGDSPAMMLRAGLMEIVERDAVLCAWETGLRLPGFGPPSALPEPLTTSESMARQRLLVLWSQIEDNGLTPGLHRLPTPTPGVFAVVGSVSDSSQGHRPISTVGLKASDRPWESLLGALQEAIQVREAVLANRPGPGKTVPHPIRTEEQRLSWLGTQEGHLIVQDWLDGFSPGGADTTGATYVSTAELLDAVLADGGDPILVDLTPRLPDRLQRMGWTAGKIIPVGMQQLRMDERPWWSYHRTRLASSVQRTGLPGRFRGADPTRPHPLP